jgi:outer membrane protein insertion porin family
LANEPTSEPGRPPRSARASLAGSLIVAGVLVVAAAMPASAQPSDFTGKLIRKISIEGLERTPESEVLGRMRIRVGERYDAVAVEQEAGRLFALGKFDRVLGPFVSEFEDGVEVRFTVIEKPLISRVRFRGRKELKESDLLGGTVPVRTREGDLFNRYVAIQDEETIREKYLAAGYLFVEVHHEVRKIARGVVVTFQISEGRRVRVREVRFIGNRSIPDGDLLDLMTTREKDFWFLGLVRSGYFNYRVLQTDTVAIKRHYRRLGFLDARVEPDDIALDPDQERMVVTIRIDEGPQYVFHGYRFSGNTVFSDQVLHDLTTAPVGKSYNEERMETDRQAILNYYRDRAFIFATVERKFAFAESGTYVYIRFEIKENNEIHIDQVRVKGNLLTQDKVVRRELEFYPGEKIDNSKLLKSRSNLARLGIFQDINFSYEPTGTPSSRDLIVNVAEAGRGQIIFGVGVTNHFGVVGNLQITMRNFDIFDWPSSYYEIPDAWTGAGQTLHLIARPGTRFSRYRVTFVEPYLFDTRNGLSLTFQSLDILREDWEEGRTGFQPEIIHRFAHDDDLAIRFNARISEIKVSDVEIGAPDDAFAAEGHTTVVGVGVGMDYDKTLEEPFELPHDGHRESISYSHVGTVLGGDIDYHSVHASQDLYFPIYTHRDSHYHHVIAFKTRYGVMKPLDETDTIPIFERFFLGGPNDVKGFNFRGLGPHQRREPTGGTAELWGTLEYSFPIFQRLLRGVVFVDYGNLAMLANFRMDQMRYSAGGGVRISFPFLGGQPLPIGLYFGKPLQSEDGDEERLFLFTIGNAF